MKNIVVMSLLGILSIFVFSCATMQEVTNIRGEKEFIRCTDEDCTVCGGTGELVCTVCGGAGNVDCRNCDGTGRVDCGGNPVVQILGIGCRNGWAHAIYPQDYEGSVDDEGYVLDAGTGERLECSECGGAGTLSCRTCRGSSLVDCGECNGTGVLWHGYWEYFSVCSNCGERLAQGAANCTSCGLNEKAYQCKECGALSNENADVCPECGAGS